MAFKVKCVLEQSAGLSSIHRDGLQLSYRDRKEDKRGGGRERPDDVCNNVSLQCKV